MQKKQKHKTQKKLQHSNQKRHQGNQVYDEAFLLNLKNALGKMLNLHQYRISKNVFDLKFQDIAYLKIYQSNSKIQQKYQKQTPLIKHNGNDQIGRKQV